MCRIRVVVGLVAFVILGALAGAGRTLIAGQAPAPTASKPAPQAPAPRRAAATSSTPIDVSVHEGTSMSVGGFA